MHEFINNLIMETVELTLFLSGLLDIILLWKKVL